MKHLLISVVIPVEIRNGLPNELFINFGSLKYLVASRENDEAHWQINSISNQNTANLVFNSLDSTLDSTIYMSSSRILIGRVPKLSLFLVKGETNVLLCSHTTSEGWKNGLGIPDDLASAAQGIYRNEINKISEPSQDLQSQHPQMLVDILTNPKWIDFQIISDHMGVYAQPIDGGAFTESSPASIFIISEESENSQDTFLFFASLSHITNLLQQYLDVSDLESLNQIDRRTVLYTFSQLLIHDINEGNLG
jgi:hypothetical protein